MKVVAKKKKGVEPKVTKNDGNDLMFYFSDQNERYYLHYRYNHRILEIGCDPEEVMERLSGMSKEEIYRWLIVDHKVSFAMVNSNVNYINTNDEQFFTGAWLRRTLAKEEELGMKLPRERSVDIVLVKKIIAEEARKKEWNIGPKKQPKKIVIRKVKIRKVKGLILPNI